MKFVLPPSYTAVPNEILDEVMPDANAAELKVTLAIARATFGWGKEERLLSNADLCELSGLSRQSVTEGLKAAEKRGYIGKRHVGGNRWLYGLRVKKDDTAQKLGSPDSDTNSSKTRKPTTSEKQTPTGSKENNSGAKAPVDKKADKKAGKGRRRSSELFEPDPESDVDQAIVEVFTAWRDGTGRDDSTHLTVHRAGTLRSRLHEAGRVAPADGEREEKLAFARAELLEAVAGMVGSDWHQKNGVLDFTRLFRSRNAVEEFRDRHRSDNNGKAPEVVFDDYERFVERGK